MGAALRIIPVIDVLNGVAVHAVRGKRKEYRPIKSTLCESPNPLEVALTFRSLGFSELYIADLDAIMGGRPSLPLLKRLAGTGLATMVDAGITNIADARALLTTGASRVVIGTETLTDPNFLKQAVDSFGSERVRLSLDMHNQKLLTRSSKLDGLDPASAASLFGSMGVTSFIALDLARVGSLQGPDTNLLETLLRTIRGEILVGGGIRNSQDLTEVQSLGAHGALIATSLHSGAITIQQLRQSNFIPRERN